VRGLEVGCQAAPALLLDQPCSAAAICALVRVLCRAGQSTLLDDGEVALLRLGQVLKAFPAAEVLVLAPVAPDAGGRPSAAAWRLAGTRAAVAAEALGEAGFPARQVAIAARAGLPTPADDREQQRPERRRKSLKKKVKARSVTPPAEEALSFVLYLQPPGPPPVAKRPAAEPGADADPGAPVAPAAPVPAPAPPTAATSPDHGACRAATEPAAGATVPSAPPPAVEPTSTVQEQEPAEIQMESGDGEPSAALPEPVPGEPEPRDEAEQP